MMMLMMMMTTMMMMAVVVMMMVMVMVVVTTNTYTRGTKFHTYDRPTHVGSYPMTSSCRRSFISAMSFCWSMATCLV